MSPVPSLHLPHSILLANSILLALASSVAISETAHGQLPLEQGESVKVMHLGDLRPGVVLARDKDRYGVEFEFGNTTLKEVFERKQIRKACEVDAIDFARVWTSSNGNSKIEAALRNFSGDKIVLMKIDETEIEVAIESLGEKDKAYLKKFRKQLEENIKKGKVPSPTPKLPELEDYGSVSNISISAFGNEGKLGPVGAMPSYFENFEQSGCGFYFTRENQELVAVIPVGGPEQLVLVTAREDNFANDATPFQSEAYWVSLKQRKVLGSVAITPDDMITDYDPRTKRLVSIHQEGFSRAKGEADRNWITLWSLKPGNAQAEPIARWGVEVSPFVSREPYVKLINQDIVLVKTDSRTYVAWNTNTKQIAYSFKPSSFFDAKIFLSPDRKSIVLSEDGKVSVLDAVSGELLYVLPVKARNVAGASINPAGTKLAALTEQNVFVWDLSSGSQEPQAYEAPLIGSPFSSRIEWVDDDLLLAEGSSERVLYRLSLQLPVWSYRIDGYDGFINSNPMVNQVLNGLLFYVARPDKFKGSVAIGAVKLPGPKVEEITKAIDKKSLMILKEGIRVGIKMESVNDPSTVQQWLIDKIKANGWVYDPNAAIQMIAKMGVGERQSETYQERGPGGQTFNVQFTPHFATLAIQKDQTVIWQSGTSTGLPMTVNSLTLQTHIAMSERPQTSFFQYVEIPKEIIDPKYSRGFGVSKLGLRGIEVESTSPPGREDDPSKQPKESPSGQQRPK
jgi:hypothetical protein